MKKALLAIAMVMVSSATFAQGTLIFKTLGIQKADGSGNYNVPIYQDPATAGNSTTGAGSLQGGVTLGLFTAGSAQPFATSLLGTIAAQSPYAVNPASQTPAVPGSGAGTTPIITVRAWQGSSFAAASAQFSGMSWGEWSFTTKPLGGDPGGGALPITPPTMTGFGPESGAGFAMTFNPSNVPEPSTIALGVLGVGALLLRRRK